MAENLLLQPIPNGEPVLFHEEGQRVDRIAFDSHRLRMAVSWVGESCWIDVYEYTEGEWRRTGRRNGAYSPRWTDRGLALAMKDGFHLSNDGRDVAFVGADLKERPGDASDAWAISADGAWLLRWTGWTLMVTNTTSGNTVLSYEWKRKQEPGLCASAFAGDRLRVFTCSGLLLDFDLATFKLTRKDDFGSPMSIGGSWNIGFGKGGSTHNYDAGLSPSGDWILVLLQSGDVSLRR